MDGGCHPYEPAECEITRSKKRNRSTTQWGYTSKELTESVFIGHFITQRFSQHRS
jgi:hypothetical protein